MADINNINSINPFDNQHSSSLGGKSTPSSPLPVPNARELDNPSSLSNFFQGTMSDYLSNNKNSYSAQDYNTISSMLQDAASSLNSGSASIGEGLSCYMNIASAMGSPISNADLSSTLTSIAKPQAENAAAAVKNIQNGLSAIQGQVDSLPQAAQPGAQILLERAHKHVDTLLDASESLSSAAEALSSLDSSANPESTASTYTNFAEQSKQFTKMESSASSTYSKVQQAVSAMQTNAAAPELPTLFQPIMGDVENLWSLFTMSSSTSGQIANSPQSFAMLCNTVNSFCSDYGKLTNSGQQIPQSIQQIWECMTNLKNPTGDSLYSLSQQFLTNPTSAYTTWQQDYPSFCSAQDAGSLYLLSKFLPSTPQSNSPLGNFWQDYKQQFVDPSSNQPYAIPTFGCYQLGADLTNLTNALNSQPINYSNVASLITQLNQAAQQELLNNPNDGYAQAIANFLNAPTLLSDPNSSLADLAENGNPSNLQAIMSQNTNGFSYLSSITSSFENIYIAESTGWISSK